MSEKESYGAPLMRKLVLEAQSLHIKVSANRDLMSKLWVVQHDGTSHIFPTCAGAAGACWFVRGMIVNAKNQISVMLAAQATGL